ncbi:ribonuclease-like protein T2 [Rhexocercosporidium sp. MPI-PUGE-AT-0058]|nr:ribonuclease-like protein T2 [Rhexocercosporidium sp. MPI-PUGE-AT-0058]
MAFYNPVLALLALPAVLALGTPKTCANPQLSCGTSTSTDLCCFNSPGGQMLQTQFWDTDPATGPTTSWTVHGLWPDHCDGTFDANCDSTRAYTGITGILQSFGKTDLLSYMQTYWKDYSGDDESFWEHEWGKHGTCISTLKPTCYTGYTSKQEVVDYFQKAVDLYKTLDSYTFLKNANIVPSTTATYTSAAIQAALKAGFGYPVTIQCSSGALNEIWYSYDVRGSVQTGEFIAAAPVGQTGSCPSTGIKYLPKGAGSGTPTTTGSGSTPTGGSFSGTGYLNAVTGGSAKGCIISAGTWYASGTCATITATASGSGFTMKSSKGNCGIVSSTFTCASGVTATVFTASGGKLAYNGATTFYAAAVPSGSTQQTVYTTSKAVSVTFQWASA